MLDGRVGERHPSSLRKIVVSRKRTIWGRACLLRQVLGDGGSEGRAVLLGDPVADACERDEPVRPGRVLAAALGGGPTDRRVLVPPDEQAGHPHRWAGGGVAAA